jgi:hypothetical protein
VSRRLGAALAALALLLTTGCQATVRVVVTATSAGRGEITVSALLDPAAAARLGPLATAPDVADLERDGWVSLPASTAPDGAVTVAVEHPFSSPAEATSLLRTLGPAFALSVTRHTGLVHSTVRVGGTVDVRDGVDAASDPALHQAVGVPSLASALATLKASGGQAPGFTVQVVENLPARPARVAGGGLVTGLAVTWTVPLGQRVSLAASARSLRARTLGWLAAAAVCLVAALLLALSGRRRPGRGRRANHHDHWSLPDRPLVGGR